MVWGDAANWAGAVATLAAVVVALRTAKRSDVRADLADARLAEEIDKNRAKEARAQAEGVSWWISLVSSTDSGGEDYAGVEGGFGAAAPPSDAGDFVQHLRVHIANTSSSPVYSCVIKDGTRMEAPKKKWVGTLPPGERAFKDWIRFTPTPTHISRVRAQAAGSVGIVEWLEFVDQAGVVWRRFGDGQLKRQDKTPESGGLYSM